MSQHADPPRSNHVVQVQPLAQSGFRDQAIPGILPRQNSISRANRAAVVVPTAAPRRPIPSPLQTTHSYRATSSPDVKSPTLTSPRATRFPVTPLEQHQHQHQHQRQQPQQLPHPLPHHHHHHPQSSQSSPSAGHARPTTAPHHTAHAADVAFEETKAVAARDALLEDAAISRLEKRKRPFATPIRSPAVADLSPLSARNMAPPSNVHGQAPTPARPEYGSAMHRTASLDSTASSLSSTASQNFKQSQPSPQETITPQDIAKLVQSSGSADAAILRLLQEKQSVAAHTDQMWRIMEKQRTMIFGLKSDLERALKEKDKYRKKLKDHLAMSAAGQSLATALKQSATSARADSQSPTATIASSNMLFDDAMNSRKASDATETSGLHDLVSRSPTPQQPSQSPSIQEATYADARPTVYSPVEGHSSKLPHAPLSASSLHHVTMPEYRIPTGTPPLTPNLHSAPHSPRSPRDNYQSDSFDNMAHRPSLQGFSSPKGGRSHPMSRKAPPAPLNLSPQQSPRQPLEMAHMSDSEYEDDIDSDSDDARGRQKTRADDDRYREALAMKEHPDQPGRDKKSKSKSKSAPPPLEHAGAVRSIEASGKSARPDSPNRHPTQTMAAMISHLRTVSDAEPNVPSTQSISVPTLLGAGLPMSPRPGDRPMNSPMPRAPKQPLAGIPMSPRDGGMPLSPRAPKGPIPFPPQTPLSFAAPNPMIARAEALQQLSSPTGGRLLVPGHPSPETEQPTTTARSPGEVYRGLVSEQYPGLLLPPNALPSIFIKVDSSRLRPSRNSYMAPRATDENPVFTLAIFARSDDTQLWRVEKTLAALSVFDQQMKVSSGFRTKLPDKGLFTGHAPARIDARRIALGTYFDSLLDTPMNDQAAMIICGFLTADAFSAEATEYFPKQQEVSQPVQITVPTTAPRKDGYLTKRGKNFGGWKARYFVLDGPQLKYFEAPGGALLGSIKLPYAEIGKQSTAPQTDEDVDNQYRHAFLILEPKRKDSASHVRHVLCAESDEERDAWVECLLKYVYDEPDRRTPNPLPTPKDPAVGARSPRLQKSMGDVNRPASSGRASSTQGSLRSVPYQHTVAAEAPVMGATSLKGRDTPEPPTVSSPILGDFDDERSHNYPFISGPTNAKVISDAQSWGNRPAAQTPVKDKKRSIFGFGGHSRGRASSDTAAVTAAAHQVIRPVFGVPLIEAVEHSAPFDVPVLMPAVAYRCIEYLKYKGATSEEGIFRLSGSNIVIKALRERFNTEGDINLIEDEHNYDVHAVASLLKQYLRELPANILTRELHFEFLNAQERDERAKLDACNALVNQLPSPNRELLEALTAFLREIVDNEKINKMSVRNVGIVFAPTLNIPATLISLFVTEHSRVFRFPIENSSGVGNTRNSSDLPSDAVRSPHKQAFSDVSTPGYGQNFRDEQYQQALAQRSAYDTGYVPVAQSYSPIQSQGEGGFGSLNSALAPPVKEGPKVVDMRGGNPSTKQSRRESNTLFLQGAFSGGVKDNHLQRLQENEGMGDKF